MDELEKYYNYLKSKGADLPPDFNTFKTTLSDDKTARTYFDYIKKKGFDAPDDYDTFASTLGLKKKEFSSNGSPVSAVSVASKAMGYATPQSTLPSTNGVGTTDKSLKPKEKSSNGLPQTSGNFSIAGVNAPAKSFKPKEESKVAKIASDAVGVAYEAEENSDEAEKNRAATKSLGTAAVTSLASVVSSTFKAVGVAAKQFDFFNEYDGKKAEDLAFYKAGQWIDDKVKDLAGELSPEEQDRFAVKLVQGAGTVGGFILGGFGSKVLKLSPFLTTAGLGAAVGGVSEYKAAIQSGATDDQAAKVFWLNAAFNTTEAFPIMSMFRKLDKYTGGLATGALAKRLASTVGGRITNQVAQGIVFETAQEVTVQALSNVVAANTYDSIRKIYDGLLETAAISTIIGGSMNGAASIIRERRAKGGLTKAEDNQLAIAQKFAEEKATEALNPDKTEVTTNTPKNKKVKAITKAKTDIEADLASTTLPEETQTIMRNEVAALDEQLESAKSEAYQQELDGETATIIQGEIAKNEALLTDNTLSEGTKAIIQKTIDADKETLTQLTPPPIEETVPKSDGIEVVGDIKNVGEEMGKGELPDLDGVYKILEDEEGRQGGSWLNNEFDDAKFESEEQARNYAKEVHSFLNSIAQDKEITVYRAVSADDVDLSPYGIGESWSFDINSAKEFGGRLGVPTSKVKIISGKVPRENVDWEAAVRNFHNFSDVVSGESEFELPIPSNRVIKDVRVEDYKTAKERGEENNITKPKTEVKAIPKPKEEKVATKGAFAKRISPKEKPTTQPIKETVEPQAGVSSNSNEDVPKEFTAKGKNKVVDDNGNPIILYHGTHKDFVGFDPNFDYENIPDNMGQVRDYETPYGVVFLTDNSDRTKSYGGKTVPVIIRAKKVLKIDAGNKSPDRFFDDDYNGENKIWSKFDDGGYDAIEISGETPKHGKVKTYITFPQQIKAVEQTQPQNQKNTNEGVKEETKAKKEKKSLNLQNNGSQKENITSGQDKGSRNSPPTSNKEKTLTEKVKAIEDVTDPYDRALQHFANEGKIHPSEITRLFGNKGDKSSRIGIIANNAATVKKLAHQLWETDPSGNFTDRDYIDAIERVLTDFNSKAAMQKDLVDRYDFESAANKHFSQLNEPEHEQETKQTIDIISGMTEDEINNLLQLDADKSKENELENYIDELQGKQETKPEITKKAIAEKESVKKLADNIEKKGANKAMADWIREKKIRGAMSTIDFGITQTIYNGAIDLMAKQIEKGTKVGNAIANAIKWIDAQVGGKAWNKAAFGKEMSKTYTLKVNGKDEVVTRDDTKETAKVINGFYSPLEQRILDVKEDKMPAKKWMERLNTDEAKWTGVTEFLQSKGEKYVSKNELTTFMQNNRIEIVEVVKGGDAEYQAEKIKKQIKDKGFGIERDMSGDIMFTKDGEIIDESGIEIPKDVQELGQKYYDLIHFDGERPNDITKYSQYQLEGEKENYKEVLITFPNKIKKFDKSKVEIKRNIRSVTQGSTELWYDGEKLTSYSDDPTLQKDGTYKQRPESEWAKVVEDIFNNGDRNNRIENKAGNFKSPHWDGVPNILVHLRMNTRTDAEGKKVLFVEEVQSDWGQKGKKEGFKPDNFDKLDARRKEIEAEGFKLGADKTPKSLKDEWVAIMNKLQPDKNLNNLPQAPFVTDTNSWVKLGLKKAIQEAVNSGAEKIAWVTGEQSNERYDLSKTVDSVAYRKNEDGTYHLMAVKGDDRVLDEKTVSQNKIEDYVGKEVAQRIINEEGEEAKALQGNKTITLKELTGEQLKVGGKGMKGFYGEPSEGKEGIVGSVAKALVKELTGQATEIVETNLIVKNIPDGNPVTNTEDVKFFTKSGFTLYEDGKIINKSRAYEVLETGGGKLTAAFTGKLTQHSIEITPELKQSVKEGMPLFGEAKSQKFSDRIRKLADDIGEGKVAGFGKGMEGVSRQGFGGEGFNKAIREALYAFAEGIDKFNDFNKAVEIGFQKLKKYYKENTKTFDEGKLRKEFTDEAKKQFDEYQADILKGEVEGKEETKTETKSTDNTGDENISELQQMASNIPNSGNVREYGSKETIEKYHSTDIRNDQKIIEQELLPAIEHGIKIVEKAKELYGEKYVDGLLSFLETATLKAEEKALIYVTLENELQQRVDADPQNLGIKKQQDLVRAKSQAHLRSSSLAINMGRIRKIAEVGYDVTNITDRFFSTREKEEKAIIEKAIEANADEINNAAEEKNLDTAKLIEEAVESEINKIYERLPTARKQKADKAIAALEKIQKQIRSKSYDATIGVPLAIIDAGITVISRALKAGVYIADAIELGIEHIKEKYGKEWNKEDVFRKDMMAGFEKEGIKKDDADRLAVKDLLIKAGFGRDKVKEGKKPTLDWRKLAGEEGSIDRMKENVEKALSEKYSDKEIKDIQKEFEEEYNDLRTWIIEKSINELNKRNKRTITTEQKSAALKLAELYNYGLFEQDPVKYNVLMAKAVGIDRLNPKRFEYAHQLGKALEVMFSSKFNQKRLNETELRTGIQYIEDKMRIMLHDEAQQHGSTSLRIADYVRTWMDATQRMMLNHLKQGIENPLSGWQQTIIGNIDQMLDSRVGSTKELRQRIRKTQGAVYKDMVLHGGVGYGDVNTTFVNKGNLEGYINKMSDSKLFHAITSTAIGKTTLDAADSFFKTKLTEQKFTHNLIKILSQPRLVDGKLKEGMSKQDAINYVSEKLTGQSFEDAQKTAKEIIDKVNKDKKIIGDSQYFIDRLANDIVKAALVNNQKITAEQVTSAYNAAYKAAGRSLGHEPNNPLSEGVQKVSAAMEKRINDAIKDKEYKKAAMLTYLSVFYRNILNPFVGGGTNWVVLKLEKNGLGLVSGLYNGGRSKVDLTSEAGMKNLERSMYEESRDRDAFMRGAIGGAVALGMSILWFGVTDDDEYRKWRSKNMWAARYLDLITPEAALASMAHKDEKLKYYLETVFNKNSAFDKGIKAIKAVTYFAKGDTDKGLGLTGEVIGGSVGLPIPWRLVRDGHNVWLGTSGQDPIKVSNKPSTSFWGGALKAGFVDYLGLSPQPAPNMGSLTTEEKNEPTIKTFIDKGIEISKPDPDEVQTKEINGKVTEHLNDYDKEVQKDYVNKWWDYYKEELRKIRLGERGVYVDKNGTATAPTSSDDRKGKTHKEFKDLTVEQIKNVLGASIKGSITEKVKKEVLSDKVPQETN